MSTPSTHPVPRDPTKVKHLVITVHGIRTFGAWQQKLGDLLYKETRNDDEFEVLDYGFDWFSALRFILPPTRWFVTRRFRRWLLRRYEHRPGLQRVDFVAHSFGTWVVADTLRRLPAKGSPPTGTVVLVGSVLKEDFPWNDLLDQGKVRQVVNECAIHDVPLILSQLTGIGTGMAGRIGFDGGKGLYFRNRFYNWGHSGWFYDQQGNSSDAEMRRLWLPLLLGSLDDPIPSIDERLSLTPWEEAGHLFLRNARPVKVVMYTLLVLAPFLLLWDYTRRMEHAQALVEERAYFEQRQKELAQHFFQQAQLVELAKIVERNPALVQRFLYAPNNPGPNQSAFVARVLALLRFTDPDYQPPLRLRDRLAQLDQQLREEKPDSDPFAWHIHALVSSWLAKNGSSQEMPRDGVVPLAQQVTIIKKMYEAALERYQEHQHPPVVIALCRLDYGRSMIDLEQSLDGITQLQRALDFLQQEAAAWFQVEVYTHQAAAKRYQKNPVTLDEAIADLHRALQAAKSDPDCRNLLGSTSNRLGWFYLDRLDLDSAQASFDAAEQVLRQIKDDDTQAQVDWFHARHGLAMVERFLDHRDEASAAFRRIVVEIDTALDTGGFSWKQRQALIARLVNACERQGDCMLVVDGYGSMRATDAIEPYENVVKYSERYKLDQDIQGLLTLAVNRCKLGVAYAIAGSQWQDRARANLNEVEKMDGKFSLPSHQERLRLFRTLAHACVQAFWSDEASRPQQVQRLQTTFLALAAPERPQRFQRDEFEFLVLAAALLSRLQAEDPVQQRMVTEATNRLKQEQAYPRQPSQPSRRSAPFISPR